MSSYYQIELSKKSDFYNRKERIAFADWLKEKGFIGDWVNFMSYRFIWIDLYLKKVIIPRPNVDKNYRPRIAITIETFKKNYEDNRRESIFAHYGLKTTITKKTGCFVIMSNKPILKKHPLRNDEESE